MPELDALLAELKSSGELTLAVKVIPKSSRNQIIGRMADGALKVKITAAPEKGKANAELCSFLARQLGVPKANVVILRGETSPHKRIRILAADRPRRPARA